MIGDEPATELLRQLGDVDIDEVAVRRLRQRVLGGVPVIGERSGPRRRRGPSWRFFVAAPILAAALILVWTEGHRGRQDTFAVKVESLDGSAIQWSRSIEGGTEWIDLRDGHFRIEIHAHATGDRVAVRVPDGRIEDFGTTFDVWLEQGRTTRVHLIEGRVALWLRGALGAVLTSGEDWERPTAELVPQPLAPPPAPSALRRSPPRLGLPATTRRQESDEDAAYLSVIRLVRAARSKEARDAAQDYLARFPNGFRATEMEKTARH